MSEHIGGNAELYSLGVLEPDAAAEVEAHVRDCGRCSAALGRAEDTVAALTDATVFAEEPPARLAARLAASAALVTPPTSPPSPTSLRSAVARPSTWYAAAAVFIVAAFLAASLLLQNMRLRDGLAQDDLAFATLANAHFRHVDFIGSVHAKAIYARDGAWAYVIVAAPDCRCRVVARDGATARNLGTPQRRGKTETLLVRNFGRAQSISLIDDRETILANANLTY